MFWRSHSPLGGMLEITSVLNLISRTHRYKCILHIATEQWILSVMTYQDLIEMTVMMEDKINKNIYYK